MSLDVKNAEELKRMTLERAKLQASIALVLQLAEQGAKLTETEIDDKVIAMLKNLSEQNWLYEALEYFTEKGFGKNA